MKKSGIENVIDVVKRLSLLKYPVKHYSILEDKIVPVDFMKEVSYPVAFKYNLAKKLEKKSFTKVDNLRKGEYHWVFIKKDNIEFKIGLYHTDLKGNFVVDKLEYDDKTMSPFNLDYILLSTEGPVLIKGSVSYLLESPRVGDIIGIIDVTSGDIYYDPKAEVRVRSRII